MDRKRKLVMITTVLYFKENNKIMQKACNVQINVFGFYFLFLDEYRSKRSEGCEETMSLSDFLPAFVKTRETRFI